MPGQRDISRHEVCELLDGHEFWPIQELPENHRETEENRIDRMVVNQRSGICRCQQRLSLPDRWKKGQGGGPYWPEYLTRDGARFGGRASGYVADDVLRDWPFFPGRVKALCQCPRSVALFRRSAKQDHVKDAERQICSAEIQFG
jgi:hypothetical protein